MRDADQTIEALLAGLRDVEPTAGLQRRILNAVEQAEIRAAQACDSPWRRFISAAMLHPAIVLPLLCAAVGAVLLTASIQLRGPRLAMIEVTPGSIHAPAAFPTRPEGVARKLLKAPRATALPASRKQPRASNLAARMTQVASYPAPPLPLTGQEKLLLRLAHRGDPGNAAMLSPKTRAAEAAKAVQQFQQFFGMNANEMRSELE